MSEKNHEHGMIASSKTDCFRSFIGCEVKGILVNALPLHHRGQHGTHTLIFKCGWGLTISGNGSYWIEKPDDASRAIGQTKDRSES